MKLNYFNFKPFKDKILLTNDLGQYTFLSPAEFKSLLKKEIDVSSELYEILKDRNIIYDDSPLEYSAQKKYEVRELKNHVNTSTSLHIFVVTTACNMNCVYCQANSGKEVPHMFMTKEIAENAIDIALQSPSVSLDFEFQGGEPLLNFDLIKHMVAYTEQRKGHHSIRYNIVTNLTLLTDEMIQYFKKQQFGVSTSLDGFKELHDYNRKFGDGNGTYDFVASSVKRLRDAGIYVGAIETTTRKTLENPEKLIEEYVNMGFESIFIRPLTPLGKAKMHWEEIGYSVEEFLEFYNRAIDALVKANKKGIYLKESHASILLKRINGWYVNYMELRSPCGAGIGQLAYYCDGKVFTCDEGRMLYEMGDDTFCLGNVFENSFGEIINNSVCRTVCASSILETIPTCCDCVYQPYCGTCPVVSYATANDVLEKQPRGYRCKIYSGLLDIIFSKFLENDTETVNIINSWSN